MTSSKWIVVGKSTSRTAINLDRVDEITTYLNLLNIRFTDGHYLALRDEEAVEFKLKAQHREIIL